MTTGAGAPRDDRARRARTLRIAGVIGLAAAVLFYFGAGWIPALSLVVLAAGNLLAAGPVAATGVAPTPIRALIVVGGIGFVVSIVVTTIGLVMAAP